jgi:quercetin dioxygenase-like cupin family protein
VKVLGLSAAIMLLASPLSGAETNMVRVTPIFSSTVTESGQPIVFPQGKAQVVVSTYEVAPGASLPEHKHPYIRYGYVLMGTLRVTNTDTGKSDLFKAGDFIVEAIDQWHQGANIGTDPVLLLVIDQVDENEKNVIIRQ